MSILKGCLLSVYLFSLTVGCGDNPALNEEDVLNSQASVDEDFSNMKLYESKSDLPICADSIRNYMAYVSSEKTIYTCNGSSWLAVDLLADSNEAKNQDEKEIFSIIKLEKGSEQCSNGGVLVVTGIDQDSDKKLSESEISESKPICNGADGMAIESIYRYTTGFDYLDADDISPTPSMSVFIGDVQLVRYSNGSYFLSVNGGVLAPDLGEDYGWADFNHTEVFASSDDLYESSLLKFYATSDLMIWYMFSKDVEPVLTVSVSYATDIEGSEFFDYYLWEDSDW